MECSECLFKTVENWYKKGFCETKNGAIFLYCYMCNSVYHCSYIQRDVKDGSSIYLCDSTFVTFPVELSTQ